MAKELDNKKMWESIIKNKTGFQNICVLDIVNALNDQGLTVEFDKIVSIEPASTIIKAGKWYVCDAEMINENMNVTFHRGEVYYCPKDGYIDVNGILFKVGSLCSEFRPATPEETKWYITITDFHDKDLDGAFNMPVFCQGEITTKEKVYDTIQYMDDTMFSAYFRPVPTEEVLKAKHGITGIRFNKAESEHGEIIAERSICDYDHKKMLETLMQDSQRMVSAKAKEAGYDRPEQTNWTKNYDWNNGTMTIYNLSKEEHLKVVEFLDCLRHPDVPETDFGKKELANSARTCKDSQKLMEFEKELATLLGLYYICKSDPDTGFTDVEFSKEYAKELLSIARKQIASEIDVDAMVSDTIICENLAYYRQGIEDTIKKIEGE